MPESTGEWFKISRREFAAAGAASIALAATGKVAAMSQQPPTTAPADVSLQRLERGLGRPISAELRNLVAQQIKEADDAWQRGRTFPVPDGTEPAVIFQPTPNRKLR